MEASSGLYKDPGIEAAGQMVHHLQLLDLQWELELRVFQSAGTSFHPKTYLLFAGDGEGTAFVGSSYLSGTALLQGIE
jgi:HKD family nuclease